MPSASGTTAEACALAVAALGASVSSDSASAASRSAPKPHISASWCAPSALPTSVKSPPSARRHALKSLAAGKAAAVARVVRRVGNGAPGACSCHDSLGSCIRRDMGRGQGGDVCPAGGTASLDRGVASRRAPKRRLALVSGHLLKDVKMVCVTTRIMTHTVGASAAAPPKQRQQPSAEKQQSGARAGRIKPASSRSRRWPACARTACAAPWT